MKFILGKKLEMSQIFDEKGNIMPVTLVQAGPCVVLQKKTKENDGYDALQFGFGIRKSKNISKSQIGHYKNLGTFQVLREARATAGEVGEKIDASIFQEGDAIKIAGISKAKGFQGVVKRHGFHGAPATHGTKHAHRQPGSIGATWPQRVVKGRRMAGRMGGERIMIEGLKIIKVDPEKHLMAVKGAVPGVNGSLLEIYEE